MKRVQQKTDRRSRRKKHIRKNIIGTTERPRLTVFRSNTRIYVQVIDDSLGQTVVSASNLEQANREIKRNVEGAEKLGTIIGERLKEKNIDTVVFDRNGYLYHGIVKAVAEGARKTGIKF